MVPDEPDLLRHVTQLDVRDNRLTELDACVFPKLEMLHCERNRIVCLKAKGSFLKGIYASSNGGFFLHEGHMWLGKTDSLSSYHHRLADFCLSDLTTLSRLSQIFSVHTVLISSCSPVNPLTFHISVALALFSSIISFLPSFTSLTLLRISHLPALVIDSVRPCCRLMRLLFSPQSCSNWLSAPCPPISVTWTFRGETNSTLQTQRNVALTVKTYLRNLIHSNASLDLHYSTNDIFDYVHDICENGDSNSNVISVS